MPVALRDSVPDCAGLSRVSGRVAEWQSGRVAKWQTLMARVGNGLPRRVMCWKGAGSREHRADQGCELVSSELPQIHSLDETRAMAAAAGLGARYQLGKW